MNLLEKYHVQDHLTNLKDRIDPHDFHQDSLKIEDILGPRDVDVKPILDFRAEINRRDEEKAKQRATRCMTTHQMRWQSMRPLVGSTSTFTSALCVGDHC